MTTRAISGGAVQIWIGAVAVGYGTRLNGQETIQNTRVEALGEIYSKEIVPTGVTVQFTVDLVRIKEEPLRALGLWPSGDTLSWLSFPELTITVLDTASQRTIYKITGARASSRNIQVDARGLLSENVTFEAIRLEDVA
jgi:hypothetical protein